MKLRSATKLAGFSLFALASVAAAHCGSGIAPHPYGETAPTATATSTPQADGGTAVFTQYAPAGCAYTFTPSTTRPFTSYALDTQTAPPPNEDGGTSQPQLVRVGVAGNTTKGGAGYADPTTTAAFSWITTEANTNARVQIGTSPTSFTAVHTGYVYTSPPPAVAFGSTEPPAYFHEVDVCGLTPGTTYYYQVGGGAAGQEIWSATQSFTTVPTTGTITVGVFGDARDVVSTWQLVHERMRDAAPAILLISGDIVDIGQEESLYTSWLSAIWHDPNDPSQFITLGQFIMVPAPGNHEQDTSQFFANFPIPGEGDYAKQYDSFDVGNTHFILIDDQPIGEEPTGAAAAAILQWVDADLNLANQDRTNHPFIVAVSHRGMFSTSEHATDPDVLQVRSSLGPLYDKYHVDLAMNGHDHEYERTYPLNVGTPATGVPVVQSSTAKGTTYVINAGAGADPYDVGTYPSNYRDGNPTSLGSLSTKGYVGCYALLTLSGTTLKLTSYGMKAGSGGVAGDDVIDTLTIGQ